jgi:hypothetical protein
MKIEDPRIVLACHVQIGDLLVERVRTMRVVSIAHRIGAGGLNNCVIRIRPVDKTASDGSADMICMVEPNLELPLVATAVELLVERSRA